MVRLRRFSSILPLVLLLLTASPLSHAANFAPPALTSASAGPRLIYTLPPGKLALARSLYHWRTAMTFLSPLWGILVLLALLNLR